MIIVLVLILLQINVVLCHIERVNINNIQSWNYVDYFAFKPTPLSLLTRHYTDVNTNVITVDNTDAIDEYGIVNYKIKLLTNLYDIR